MVSIHYITLGLVRPLLTRTIYLKKFKNYKFVFSMLVQFEKSELKTVWEFKIRIFKKDNISSDGSLFIESFTRIPRYSRPRFYKFIIFIPKKLVETETGWEEIYTRLEMYDASGTKKDEMKSNLVKVKV